MSDTQDIEDFYMTDIHELEKARDQLLEENKRLQEWMEHLSRRLEQRDVQVTAMSATLRKYLEWCSDPADWGGDPELVEIRKEMEDHLK